MEKLYEGKAKVLFPAGPDTLRVYFKDEATAFNAQKRGLIPGKGVVNNKVSATLFRYLEAHGVKTHFLEEVSDREMRVWRVEILPLEVILRFRAAGSFAKRYGVKEGTPLKTPLVEFSLKSDPLGDPLICPEAILALGLATEEELSQVKATTLKVGELLRDFFAQRGLDLVDFKLEFGKRNREILLADEISPDTMRLWDQKTGEPMDKDRFRKDLGGVEEAYQEVLRRVLRG
ncbi:phosphoribosylaminoimidazolesuccinocarboxamide synthase [Thermus scotoductus]|uniref:Phosphoribosylaminoimidazole-succinocarboxamide synthase n=1 Tax=Thermus scotoductus TaxID=37636 RepID=A0A430S7F8_THESC|nr:phosphoribosylaminoimidazolesuccinocarboxamide synthase [Thermus scotoductus]RTG94484.1 phosphoribosylaminoimidazolesuccinocarboxamide synthase [Thermus scotoductus]RTH06444.1 phosphoribosylaminoimidazolesuccinocarboxamide synthase [Thermus scotoductus]RTH09283.1 phosphoribosylaminoimidazolesuccinocarboxamide synthase [Thermus scotoductus]RTH09663.1 phosphoribosylaminoimidazolesuccinocarboxamide synthase [Thermus scotoductus]RTH14884.1 phosphoribosylaminoimidazolesuccinocarboxamide synthase